MDNINYNFKIKELTNLKFNLEELLDYYHTLEKDYQHYRFYYTKTPEVVKDLHVLEKYSTWAIQSNLKDPTKPCPPYDHDPQRGDPELDERDMYDVPTELVFGFAKKFITSLPNASQTLVVVGSPGFKLGWHVDTGDYFKIHIPITSNPDCFIEYEDEKFMLDVGKAYLVNVIVPHSAYNLGDTERAHLITRLPPDMLDYILNTEIVI